jgi:flavin-dependent dehydrogenase
MSPSSAEGFSYAFKSAIHLAQALKKSLKNFQTHYRGNSTSLRRKMFIKDLKSHIIYNPRLRKTVMKVGIGAMKLHHPL